MSLELQSTDFGKKKKFSSQHCRLTLCICHLPNCICWCDCAAARPRLRAPTRVSTCQPADTPSPLRPHEVVEKEEKGERERKWSKLRLITSIWGHKTMTKASVRFLGFFLTQPWRVERLGKSRCVDREGDAGGGALMMQDAAGLKQKWSDSTPAPIVCLLRFHCVMLRLWQSASSLLCRG